LLKISLLIAVKGKSMVKIIGERLLSLTYIMINLYAIVSLISLFKIFWFIHPIISVIFGSITVVFGLLIIILFLSSKLLIKKPKILYQVISITLSIIIIIATAYPTVIIFSYLAFGFIPPSFILW